MSTGYISLLSYLYFIKKTNLIGDVHVANPSLLTLVNPFSCNLDSLGKYKAEDVRRRSPLEKDKIWP